MDPDPATSTAAAQAALAEVATDWLARRGVVAVEVARRWAQGAPTSEVGIRVTVEQILAAADVPDGELFPSELEGVPVDLVEGRPASLE